MDFRIKIKFKIARTACLFFITSNVHSCSEQESSILIIYMHICARCDVKIISKCKCYNKQLISGIVSINWKKHPYGLIQYIYHSVYCTINPIFDVKVQSRPHLRRYMYVSADLDGGSRYRHTSHNWIEDIDGLLRQSGGLLWQSVIFI